MKILVTGGAGFVGSHIIREELANGNEVVCLDTASGYPVEFNDHPGFCFREGSVLDRDLVAGLVGASDMVIHLAAIASPKVYCERPDMVLQINLEGTIAVSRLCLTHGKKLVFSSSSEIYGKNTMVPWREDALSITQPSSIRWCYSLSKVTCEHYIRALGARGLTFAMGRFFNFYGPGIEGRVISYFIRRFIEGRTVQVVFPGDQTRCFTYADDAVRGFLEVAHNPKAEGDVFNIGVETETTIYDLATMIKRIGGFDSKIEIVDPSAIYKEGYDDIPRRAPDTTKIRETLGWEPTVSLEEGLEKTIAAFRKEYEG